MESSAFNGSLNKNWEMMKQAGLIECPGDMAVAGLPPLCWSPGLTLQNICAFTLYLNCISVADLDQVF